MACGRRLKRSTVCDLKKFSKDHRKTKAVQKKLSMQKNSIKQSRIRQMSLDDRRKRRASLASDDGEMMSTRDAWVYSVTLIIYIMYPTLVRFPFELLQCRDVDGERWLERDLEERCFEGNHLTMLISVAIPALLLYALGIPLLSFATLNTHRHKLSTNKYRFRLGLLYSGYRPERFWWEIVVAARKVLIISMASFGFNERLQVHLVLGLMLILLICHYTFLPFDVHSKDGELLHRVERNSLLALICMLWAGVVFNIDLGAGCNSMLCVFTHNTLVVMVIAVNVVLMTYGVCLFAYFWLKRNHLLEKIESIGHRFSMDHRPSSKRAGDLAASLAEGEGEGDGSRKRTWSNPMNPAFEMEVAAAVAATDEQTAAVAEKRRRKNSIIRKTRKKSIKAGALRRMLRNQQATTTLTEKSAGLKKMEVELLTIQNGGNFQGEMKEEQVNEVNNNVTYSDSERSDGDEWEIDVDEDTGKEYKWNTVTNESEWVE